MKTTKSPELAPIFAVTAALPREEVVLPEHPHHPGTGSVAETALLSEVKATCPKVTDPDSWRKNRPYRYGWSLFEAGFYWEAHEVWEPVWLACRQNSLEKIFLRAAIQMTNACLKRVMGNRKAARRLFDHVDELLEELKTRLQAEDETYMGVDLTVFAKTENEI